MAKINGVHVGDFPGTMKDYGGGTVPHYYLLCDGSSFSALPGQQYYGLFLKIGYSFGGAGASFNVPDSRRKVHVGSGGSGTGVLGNTVGNSGGEESHQLTAAELASHNHPGSTFTGGTGTAGAHDHGPGAASQFLCTGGNNNAHLNIGGGSHDAQSRTSNDGNHNHGIPTQPVAISSQGSDTPHNTVQPSLVVTKLIRY